MFVTAAAKTGSKRLEHLLARIAAERDQGAFAELYHATKGKLFSRALLIVKRRDLVEEVIQDAYMRIWLNAKSYKSSAGAPMTWMITIARNLAIDVVRRPAPELHSDNSLLLSLPSAGLTAVEQIEADEGHRTAIEQKQRVLWALRSLDPARRDLIIAAYLHGESREQLSKKAGVPVNTVKTWIRRSLLEVEAMVRNSKANTEEVEAHLDIHAGPGRTAELGLRV